MLGAPVLRPARSSKVLLEAVARRRAMGVAFSSPPASETHPDTSPARLATS